MGRLYLLLTALLLMMMSCNESPTSPDLAPRTVTDTLRDEGYYDYAVRMRYTSGDQTDPDNWEIVEFKWYN